jgi:hypothetical protein
MSAHIFVVWLEQILAEKGMFKVSGETLDKKFAIGGLEKGLYQSSQSVHKHSNGLSWCSYRSRQSKIAHWFQRDSFLLIPEARLVLIFVNLPCFAAQLPEKMTSISEKLNVEDTEEG